MTWRDILPVHPAADLLPILRPDVLKALAQDIQKNGLLMPVTLWYDKDVEPKDRRAFLLDGRNRLDAMELVGINLLGLTDQGDLKLSTSDRPQRTEHWDGDPVTFVMSANLARRHLPMSERVRIAAELLKLYPERSDRQVAGNVGVSHPTVAKVRRSLEEAGDVASVTTTKDTRGRVQPRRRGVAAPKPAPTPEDHALPPAVAAPVAAIVKELPTFESAVRDLDSAMRVFDRLRMTPREARIVVYALRSHANKIAQTTHRPPLQPVGSAPGAAPGQDA
jgi:hypothetical protein